MKKALTKQRGFTLIELMITISIAAILLTVGIPSFSEMIKNNRLTTQINSVVASLNLARSEAVKQGLSITMCKRNAGGTGCNNGGNWQDGWIVFVDDDLDADHSEASDGNGTVDANESVLRIVASLSGVNTLTYPNNRVTFNGRGFSAGFNGTFKLCDDRGASYAKGLVIANTGRTRRATDSDSDGTVEDGSGNNLSCP